MESLINSSIIKGITFCTYDKYGPQPIYMFPKPSELGDTESFNKGNEISNDNSLTVRDYTQIAIKNLSLLIGDGSIFEKLDLTNFKYFGIIPFPDFMATSLTFYHFISTTFNDLPLATAFCILVDENKRSFFYNNISRLKEIILDFFMSFDKKIIDNYKPQEEIEKDFEALITQIIEIEKKPSTLISTNRKMKIICAGLDDSGKTSFLLSVNRKFSKLIGLKPTRGARVSSIEALGANIFLWDLGGQLSLRKKYINKAQIYLFEADLLYYFIDLKTRNRFKESIEYLQNILEVLDKMNQKTPIILILTKGDPDILDTYLMKDNLQSIRKELKVVFNDKLPEIHVTSIFEIFTILRAFSSGLAKLSPNRDLIKHNLDQLSQDSGSLLSLLLSMEGLVLADYFSPNANDLIHIPKNEDLMNIFELSAPEFTRLFKIFSRYKSGGVNEAIFNVSNSVIYFKKIMITESIMYLLFLLENEKSKMEINERLPNFLESTEDLVIRYLS
jgi:GTPase SAR1 family protein